MKITTVILTLLIVLGCQKDKIVPIKPFYIIDIEPISGTLDYDVTCIDANKKQFSFSVHWSDLEKYHVGDTIK